MITDLYQSRTKSEVYFQTNLTRNSVSLDAVILVGSVSSPEYYECKFSVVRLGVPIVDTIESIMYSFSTNTVCIFLSNRLNILSKILDDSFIMLSVEFIILKEIRQLFIFQK